MCKYIGAYGAAADVGSQYMLAGSQQSMAESKRNITRESIKTQREIAHKATAIETVGQKLEREQAKRKHSRTTQELFKKGLQDQAAAELNAIGRGVTGGSVEDIALQIRKENLGQLSAATSDFEALQNNIAMMISKSWEGLQDTLDVLKMKEREADVQYEMDQPYMPAVYLGMVSSLFKGALMDKKLGDPWFKKGKDVSSYYKDLGRVPRTTLRIDRQDTRHKTFIPTAFNPFP